MNNEDSKTTHHKCFWCRKVIKDEVIWNTWKFCSVRCAQDADNEYCEVFPEEELYDPDYDDIDVYELDESPCDDCDDRRMPYAARSCNECPHGGQERELTEVEQELLNHDDDANYRYDMWGPDSI